MAYEVPLFIGAALHGGREPAGAPAGIARRSHLSRAGALNRRLFDGPDQAEKKMEHNDIEYFRKLLTSMLEEEGGEGR